MREAADGQRFERAAALLRRRDRLAWVLERLDGMLRATHSAPRLVLARHPVKERWDALWIVAGRVADWGPLPGPDEIVRRTGAALARRAPGPRRPAIPPEEVDEIRIVHSWIAAHDPPQLELGPETAPQRAAEWAESVAASAPAAVSAG
jgi:hypothetical protein